MTEKYNNTYGWDDDNPFKKKNKADFTSDDTVITNSSALNDTSATESVNVDGSQPISQTASMSITPELCDISEAKVMSVEQELEKLPKVQPQAVIPQKNIAELPDIQGYLLSAQQALGAVDDIVSKGYLENLHKMNVLAPEELNEDNVTLFKVDLMAYDKDEYATDKFVSAFTAMTFTSNTVFLIVDGHEDRTDFYIGIKNESENSTSSISKTFENSLKGQFPGIKLTDLSVIPIGEQNSPQHRVIRDLGDATSVSSYVGLPSLKGDGQYTNMTYIQGVEKLVDAMQGKRYTAIVIARNQMPSSITSMRNAYEGIYSQLSCMATQQLAYSTNESLAHALTRSHGTTDTTSHSVSEGTSHNVSHNHTETSGTSKSDSSSNSVNEPNFWSKGSQLAGPLMMAGSWLVATGVGAPVGAAMMGTSAVLSIGGIVAGKTKSSSESHTTSENIGVSDGTSVSDGTTHNETESNSHGETLTDSEGHTSSIGSSKNFTLTLHNKRVEEILKRIDKQLERIDAAESNGLWSTSTYFLSYGDDYANSQTGASIFRSIVQGDKSGIETSALNSWKVSEDTDSQNLLRSITALSHPVFKYASEQGGDVFVDGTSLISSKELALLMGLPRKSVPGLPVIDHISLGKEVVKLGGNITKGSIDLGVIFDQGVEHPMNKVMLDAKSLTQHVFVTGSTGCGKSETVYRLIEQINKAGATYLIIEPAKGEYKSVLGDANVFGTNPSLSPLIRINPFKFPEGVHVLEHIDRLVEIFNVCWPMYAAMPAVLKKSVIRSYEACGWNLYESTNNYGNAIFPSFVDLLRELETTINESAYSEEVKGNYTGSLVTRVESLTNGINGEIFSSVVVGDDVLFDQNTIVDLSRIGAQETKALIMGILIMRLNEYRVVNAKEANSKLRHVTVLEEAHNILTRTSTEQSMEGSNVTGKSVEMLINSIAEMRTYGESFVIVDQSPTSVHSAAIKNTNTKIIMRLPDGDDRRIAGKSAALKDNEIDELAKLVTGVAVVYQNDWLQPVMCKVKMSQQERKQYTHTPDRKRSTESSIPTNDLLKLLLKGRLSRQEEPDVIAVREGIEMANIPVSNKVKYLKLLNEYEDTGKLEIWKDEHFKELCAIVVDLLGVEKKVVDFAKRASSFEELNRLLSELLNNMFSIPEYMDLTLRQVMMRNYGELGTSQLKIYNAWLNDIKKAKL